MMQIQSVVISSVETVAVMLLCIKAALDNVSDCERLLPKVGAESYAMHKRSPYDF